MESGAKGCVVVVSGKLRGQRAKSMKFTDGLMIHSGDPIKHYVNTAVRHVLLRQGESLTHHAALTDAAAAAAGGCVIALCMFRPCWTGV